jgi:hypothetical protein
LPQHVTHGITKGVANRIDTGTPELTLSPA